MSEIKSSLGWQFAVKFLFLWRLLLFLSFHPPLSRKSEWSLHLT
jgi:hypothetical protein